MFVTRGIWCLADVLSVSPSLEQTIFCLSESLALKDVQRGHLMQRNDTEIFFGFWAIGSSSRSLTINGQSENNNFISHYLSLELPKTSKKIINT